jgi:DNA-binding transcriptional ArsR family regulator
MPSCLLWLLSGGRTTISKHLLVQRSPWVLTVDDALSSTFAALAHPTRRAILARLAEGEATVNELAEPLPISGQAVSQHLQVLERAGLIERGRMAQWRPARLRGDPMKAAVEWLLAYRRFWEASFDRLDERLVTGETDAPNG